MAIPKRKRQTDHDLPAAKKMRVNTSFTIKDFMVDFPPLRGPITSDPPLPCTVLTDEELRDTSKDRKILLRSTFNVRLPMQLRGYDDEATQNAPYDWMRKQYSHCIIPELGEEFDFAYDSDTFHRLRDIHNARVRIRDGEPLPDYAICSLATRWICLGEKDRPASHGYLANGEVFIATCLPIDDDNDDLERYFEYKYSRDLSAHHYIPRSRYSVHFVGKAQKNGSEEIQSVDIASVLIRNTRTGNLVYIDTGLHHHRTARARDAGRLLKSWLEFQKEKRPEIDLGPISNSLPLILAVDKETHPTLRSIHALVSASLFLRRRITNWGDVKAFNLRNKPTSTTMANYALQNISGWLGLKSTRPRQGEGRPKNNTRHSFEYNFLQGGLKGRDQPAPVSQRIASAKKGEAPVYNEESDSDDNDASDHEGSITNNSHESVSSDEDTVIPDQPNDDYELPDDEANNDEMVIDDEPVANISIKKVTFQLPDDEESNDLESKDEQSNKEEPNTELPREPSHEEPNDDAPKDEQPKMSPANEEIAVEKPDNDITTGGNDVGGMKLTTPPLFQFGNEEGDGMK